MHGVHDLLNSPEMLKLSTDIAMKLDGALAVLDALPPDAWHYAGKDVKLNTPNWPILWVKNLASAFCSLVAPLNTPNRPILWAKNRNGTSYQVIYADLSVKEVPVEEAPKMPQSESEGGPKP